MCCSKRQNKQPVGHFIFCYINLGQFRGGKQVRGSLKKFHFQENRFLGSSCLVQWPGRGSGWDDPFHQWLWVSCWLGPVIPSQSRTLRGAPGSLSLRTVICSGPVLSQGQEPGSCLGDLHSLRYTGCWMMLLFSHSVMSKSLQSHGLQHVRLPCPSLSPGVCSDSCPLSWWWHPTISSSAAPFSSCPRSFPASGSFPTPGAGFLNLTVCLDLGLKHWKLREAAVIYFSFLQLISPME